jgi:hypothetical protein
VRDAFGTGSEADAAIDNFINRLNTAMSEMDIGEAFTAANGGLANDIAKVF